MRQVALVFGDSGMMPLLGLIARKGVLYGKDFGLGAGKVVRKAVDKVRRDHPVEIPDLGLRRAQHAQEPVVIGCYLVAQIKRPEPRKDVASGEARLVRQATTDQESQRLLGRRRSEDALAA